MREQVLGLVMMFIFDAEIEQAADFCDFCACCTYIYALANKRSSHSCLVHAYINT
jgi:hypothetical protein